MAIGRTFEEALGKAMRSLEDGHRGLGADPKAALLDTAAWAPIPRRPCLRAYPTPS